MRFKASGLNSDYKRYQEIRNQCHYLLRFKRKNYESSLVQQAIFAPKKLFSYIQRRLRKVDDIPVLQDQAGHLVEGNEEMANILARGFSSVFNPNSTDVFLEVLTTGAKFDHLVCDEGLLLTLLNKLDVQKAFGPDGHHPLVLKRLAPALATPLTFLFNRSLTTGVVPLDWKIAVIKPMFKAGNKQDAKNYRPISLTSVIIKIFEKIV